MKRYCLSLVLIATLITTAACAATLTSSVQFTAKSSHEAVVGLSTAVDNVSYNVNRSFANGTGTAQCDLVYHGQRTLSSAASESLDLAGGLTDAFGTAITFGHVKVLVIENTSASMTLTLGGDASAPWEAWASGTTVIPPSGVFVTSSPTSGFEVTATTADLLKILNGTGSSTTYKIWVVGTSN